MLMNLLIQIEIDRRIQNVGVLIGHLETLCTQARIAICQITF
jgi:hypothetical protein